MNPFFAEEVIRPVLTEDRWDDTPAEIAQSTTGRLRINDPGDLGFGSATGLALEAMQHFYDRHSDLLVAWARSKGLEIRRQAETEPLFIEPGNDLYGSSGSRIIFAVTCKKPLLGADRIAIRNLITTPEDEDPTPPTFWVFRSSMWEELVVETILPPFYNSHTIIQPREATYKWNHHPFGNPQNNLWVMWSEHWAYPISLAQAAAN